MTPWYLEPAAIDAIRAIRSKPAVEWGKEGLSGSPIAKFVGAEVGRVDAIYRQVWRATDAVAAQASDYRAAMAERGLTTFVEDVLGAIWGDPNGNEHFRTFRDASPEWDALRATLHAALVQQVAA